MDTSSRDERRTQLLLQHLMDPEKEKRKDREVGRGVETCTKGTSRCGTDTLVSSLGRLFSAPWVYGYWKASPPPSFPEGVNISPSPSVLSLSLFFCHSVFSLHQRLNAGGLRRDHSQLTHTHTHSLTACTSSPRHPSVSLSLHSGVWRTKL